MTSLVRPVAVDGWGADAGPEIVTEGARRAGLAVTLFGPVDGLVGEVAGVSAPERIDNDEDPAQAVRAKPDASIVRAARAVGAGEASALVSAGSTGAVLVASLAHIGRLDRVSRAALAALLPLPARSTLLLDAGAGTSARAEHLVQFAAMGAAFMEAAHGVERPTVALLSVGEESTKGTPAVRTAHARLREGSLRFVGNVEGGDLANGAVDVVVCDGFTGNVALKVLEGGAGMTMRAVRDAIASGRASTLGGMLVRGRLRTLRTRFDPNTTGGAVLLGLRAPVVVAHGSASAEGMAAAVRLAARAHEERLVERTADALRAAAVGSDGVGSFDR